MKRGKILIITSLLILSFVVCTAASLIYMHVNNNFRCDSFSVISAFDGRHGLGDRSNGFVYLTKIKTTGHYKSNRVETYDCSAQLNEVYIDKSRNRVGKVRECTLDYKLINTNIDEYLFSTILKDCTIYKQ